MNRAAAVLPLITALALAGCATTRSERPINASLVLWSKGDDGRCDFENPRRDEALAVSYTRNTRSAGTRRAPPSQSYAVRNAQMRERPRTGEALCLSLIRGNGIGRADAVIGFEVQAVSQAYLEIRPVSARLDRAVHARPGEITVSVAFATGLHQPGRSPLASSAQFDLGPVPTNGSTVPKPLTAQRLFWPPAPSDHDILRIGALVVESSTGAVEAISDTRLGATLSAAAE